MFYYLIKGAVIASTATPDKNKISTGTLTYSDIQNKADYSASGYGIGYSWSGSLKDKDGNVIKDSKGNPVDNPNNGFSYSPSIPVNGSAESTTKSGISKGTIEIRNNLNQDISNLNRTPDSAVNTLGKIFDKKSVEEQKELVNIFSQEANKAIGDLAESIREKVNTPEEKAKWAEGGEYKVLLHAVSSGIISGMSGNGFASGAMGDGISELAQKELSKINDKNLRILASTAIGAAAAKVVGGNAQVGGSTAYMGIKYNAYGHAPTYEGAILYTLQDGFCQIINGEKVKMNAPTPADVYIWVEDPENPGSGGDYKSNVYERDIIVWQKFVEIDGKAYGVALKDQTDADKQANLMALTKKYFEAVLIANGSKGGYNLINGSGSSKDYLESILKKYFKHLIGK